MLAYRSEVVNLAKSWIGLKESDGSYKKIIDIYNSYTGSFPRNTKMKYGWAWCACTWSAIAIKLGYTDVMPIEISCQELIKEAQKKKIWVENDAYVPKPGDAILYDWDDSGSGDCLGWADHVGIVERADKKSGYITVIEGNYKDAVKRRTISINGRYIRGFITPKYNEPVYAEEGDASKKKTVNELAHEVLTGLWGDGDARRKALEKAGYNYEDVQKQVNWIVNGGIPENPEADQKQPVAKRVIATTKPKLFKDSYGGEWKTTANLYCRNDVGTNKRALCKIPKGTKVKASGFYGVDSDNNVWLYVTVILNGTSYTGFSSRAYLVRTK